MTTVSAISIVLDFVERYNKQDSEKDVAVAAEYLREQLIPFKN